MKSVGDIAQKLKQVQFRHSKKEIEKLLSRTPSNCVFQKRVEVKGSGGLGFCTCPEIGLKACDVSAEHLNRAPDCPRFSLKMSVEEAKESVKSFFRDSPPAEIASKYPDAAALMWVLDDEVSNPPDVYLVPGLDVSLWASSPEGAQQAIDSLKDLLNKKTEYEETRRLIPGYIAKIKKLEDTVGSLGQRLTIADVGSFIENHRIERERSLQKKPGFFKSLFITICFAIGTVFRK